ncbi:PEP-CTERM sorting domain-containing protein [Candidatus Gracilibacteria bacterium]|nr:PEP-CTERM sorting domain-containing protein [Candidatus Gracilibacteria bacterium]NJM88402.1 PEP-CTERM sorting domain-containing protein [Hydrococcus sp. RU_2_2]
MNKITSCLLLAAATFAIAKPAQSSGPDDICSSRLTFTQDGQELKLPYCRNHPLGKADDDFQRALIVIHGASRNADEYYADVFNTAKDANEADEDTLIIAPQFLEDEDIEAFNLSDDTLFWSSGWREGNLSRDTDELPRPFRISSYSVIDEIIKRLVEPGKFPELDEIVIAGHSAGGQFVNRYAAGSQVQPNNTSLRYVVSNPSSYLYMNEERAIPGTLDQFAIPNASSCPTYNEYKYGLDGELNAYMETPGIEGIRSQYLSREVVYLLGGADTDPNDDSLDTDCEAMFQGSQRLERGTIYYNYLQHYYGSAVLDTHTKSIVPGVGHDYQLMFDSDAGRKFLFDYNPTLDDDDDSESLMVSSTSASTTSSDAETIPEPSTTLSLVGLGFVAMGSWLKRKVK